MKTKKKKSLNKSIRVLVIIFAFVLGLSLKPIFWNFVDLKKINKQTKIERNEWNKNFNKDPWGWHCWQTGKRIGFRQTAIDNNCTIYSSNWFYVDNNQICLHGCLK